MHGAVDGTAREGPSHTYFVPAAEGALPVSPVTAEAQIACAARLRHTAM